MAVKHFCDVCGNEIELNVVRSRLKESTVIAGTRVDVEITVGISGTWNTGDLCKTCLFTVLDRFDSRPRAAIAAA
jgi:hypothetical protein